MSKIEQARKVANHMLENDAFSRWMGVDILEAAPGRSVLQITVREEMTNGFNVGHGGIAFSLADSALAFAAGSHGRIAVTLDSNISFLKPVYEEDTLTATANEINLGKQTGVYEVEVLNQDKKKVALMRGTVYRTRREFFDD